MLREVFGCDEKESLDSANNCILSSLVIPTASQIVLRGAQFCAAQFCAAQFCAAQLLRFLFLLMLYKVVYAFLYVP